MKMNYQSTAASILSFPIALLGLSKLELTEWWHFVLALIVLLLIYFFILFLISGGVRLYEKYLQRANIKADEETELQMLDKYISLLCCLHLQYSAKLDISSKQIQRRTLHDLYEMTSKQMNFIKCFRDSKTLKYPFVNVDCEKLDEYEQFCEYIRKVYNF